MILLDVQGMDLSFNTKDVIYLIGFVVSILTAWFKVKLDKEKMQTCITQLEKEVVKQEDLYKEEVLSAKNGRKAIKKDFADQLKEKEQIMHTRIDRVRDDNIKSYEKLEKKIEELEKKYDTSTQLILNAIQNK